ncbi:MAG: 2-amino-4-hydroxy-6-hydroxymethyldihydropteridine diphosphokinase [Sedimentisphaerales bacterium]|jgi:2-amino-4-hydroxy-6-hydroxymethyldihydropteridine diphosphokinase|nr:2-amino-4-hydroxy-6-hydroxymethyldihydropteridine diphosphokinase [Sedimentisphaerales bacterium]
MSRQDDQIVIKGLQLHCKVGVSEQERQAKQEVVVDLTIWTDLTRSTRSDMLADTIDYRLLRDQIVEATEGAQFHLIEALAGRIADVCLAVPGVNKVKVYVEKPGALRRTRSVAVQITRNRPVLAFVAVGSNILPQTNIPKALLMLMERTEVLATSTFYQTEPVGQSQIPFVNGVWMIRTELGPMEVKDQLLGGIELALGRQRSDQKDAPRTIDLDLVLYDRLVCRLPGLTLPHPDLARPFVIAPILELLDRRPDLDKELGWMLPKNSPKELGMPLEDLTRQLVGILRGRMAD